MQFKQKVAWKEVAWIFGLSRLLVLLFSYLAVTFLHMQAHINSLVYIVLDKCSPGINCFLMSWWRWDAAHYVEIAYYGYIHVPLLVFFPLFPLLIRGLGFLLGGSVLADYAAGLLVANICFYGVLVLFYQLVSQDFDRITARYALIYLTFAPYAIFFFAGYTESLFLLLTLATFFFLRRGELLDWWLAGLCGFLAALTRPVGIVLIIPFVVLFLQRFGVRTDATPKGGTVNWACWLLPIALIPAGLLIYILYQWMIFGNPWLFSVEQVLWGRYLSFPWVGIFNAIRGIFTPGPFVWQDNVNDLLFTLVPVVALILGWKQLPLHYSLFSLAMILFVLCGPSQYEPLLSVPRFLLVVFPIFILFALWSKDPRISWYLVIPGFTIFFIVNVIQFAIYGWVV